MAWFAASGTGRELGAEAPDRSPELLVFRLLLSRQGSSSLTGRAVGDDVGPELSTEAVHSRLQLFLFFFFGRRPSCEQVYLFIGVLRPNQMDGGNSQGPAREPGFPQLAGQFHDRRQLPDQVGGAESCI